MDIKKYNNLTDGEKDNFYDSIEFDRSKIEDREVEAINNLSKFGVCSKCKYFIFMESEFTVEFSKCDLYDRLLNEKRAIVNCTGFAEKGQLTLREMEGMALILDFTERKVGFNNGD